LGKKGGNEEKRDEVKKIEIVLSKQGLMMLALFSTKNVIAAQK